MKKAFAAILVVLAMAALSSPAVAAYYANWTTGFDTYQPGPLHGQGPWVATDPATSPIVTGYPVYGGNKAAKQVNGASGAAADLRYIPNMYPIDPARGWAKFWVYDPGDVTGQVTDGKVGVFSSAGADSTSKMFTAGVQSSRSHDYWTVQWAFSQVVADGSSSASGTGYSFTPGQPAYRTWNAWSYVLIRWDFRYIADGGSATINWYVNQQTPVPNMTLNFDSTSTRWANCHDVIGVFIGSLTSQSNPVTYDNIEFHSMIPEPSSMLILGSGLVGIMGLIRRRR